MNKQELIEKLEDIEWEDFEVKEAKSEIPKNSWQTVSAFSNTAGGWLIFGVSQKGRSYAITGVNNPEKIEQDFTTTLRNGDKFNKKINVESKKYDFDDKIVLAFYIPAKSAREKPIYFNTQKNTFIRTASGDQRATQEEIDTFFRTASFEEKDKELCDCTLKDLDESTIEIYRQYFLSVNQGHRYNGLSTKDFLKKLGVLKDGKVTYGGLLVFGTQDALAEHLVNYRIEYLEIQGTSYEDAPTRYSFRISSEKNLIMTFFDIYERISKKIDIPFSIKSGIRDDDPSHLQAMREALVNLLIHTDYFSQANPRIRFFSDRFEFFNPGALPKKIEFILKEDFSLPRNPIIAKIFRFIKLSENIGSGFHKMFQGWKEHYNLKPLIEGDFDHYKITFPTTTTTTTKTTSKTTTKNTEFEIMELLKNNPHLTAEDVAAQIGITKDGVRYHIKNLKDKGLLQRVGSSKKGKWVVK
ncbi:MAG: RNA-binding domain-containing protein [Nanoarchaeota archaeon]